jgi:hypothetical protein
MSQELISKLRFRQGKIYDFFVDKVISKMTQDEELLLCLKNRFLKTILNYDEKELYIDTETEHDAESVFMSFCMSVTIHPNFYEDAVFKGVCNHYLEDEEQEIFKEFEQLYTKLRNKNLFL